MDNLLIKAENIKGLNYLINECGLKGKIDLIYIDPPFATGIDFLISDGRASTISNTKKGEIAYSDKIIGNDFIDFLRIRLELLKKLLSEKGAIYVHTDTKIGHYVKILMDEIFGIENFRNDIARIKCNPKNFKRIGYGNIKDSILFYTKSAKPIWNEPKEKYSEEDIKRLFLKKNSEGRRYTTVPIHAPGETKKGKSNEPFRGILPPAGRHWRTSVETLEAWDAAGLIEWSSKGNPRKIMFADEKEGKRVQDIWAYKDPQYTKYPTEKNAAILDLIIRTSSTNESIILDCFCGSGTTLKSAQIQNRTWIGIDQSEHAINATKEKLQTLMVSDQAPFYKYLELDDKN